jgi:hypothetical protein
MLDFNQEIMKINKTLSIIMVCMFLCACSKVTVQVPDSIITPSNFWKTASDADNAINGCYDILQKLVVNFEIWGDGRTDIFAATDRPSSSDLQVVSGNVSSGNDYVAGGWSALYRGLNRANAVIKNVPGITDPALSASGKDRIMGEAYFLRAMFLFYLTRTFENVPLILEPYQDLSGDFFPKQSDRSTILAQIEKDLKTAEPLVPDLPFGTTLENKGKTTKAAIRTALTDVYLWEKKYQEAADAAALVIGSPAGYTLVAGASYANIFTVRNTSESILEVQFNYTYQEDLNTISDLFLPLGGTYTAGNWRYTPSNVLLAALPATDLRQNITYRNTGAVPAPFRDANKLYFAKYQGTVATGTLYQDSNFIIYRLAQVILMRAEALNELGQTPSAIILLNQIRTRSGLPATTAVLQPDVKLAIEAERLIEFAGEGKRYFDLVRTGRYATVTGSTNVNYLRWPLPANELINNPNLVQNPGY